MFNHNATIMKPFTITLILFLCSPFSFAQNLIQNGGFESNIGIPNLPGQHYLCETWNNCLGFGTPDYYHLNGSGSASLPHNYVSTVSPYAGDAMMGIFLYESDSSVTDFREYISQELAEPLVIGQAYRLAFYVSNGKGPFAYGGYATDHFSVAFSTKQLFQSFLPNDWVIDFTPQYTYNGFLYNNDWQLITYDFVADSAYQYLTFGSFVDDATQQIALMDTASQSGGVNYYIDEVSLEVTAHTSIEDVISDQIKVFPNPFRNHLSIEPMAPGDYEITIHDISGRQWTVDSFRQSFLLNTTQWSKGVYYYQLKKSGEMVKAGKLIKTTD